MYHVMIYPNFLVHFLFPDSIGDTDFEIDEDDADIDLSDFLLNTPSSDVTDPLSDDAFSGSCACSPMSDIFTDSMDLTLFVENILSIDKPFAPVSTSADTNYRGLMSKSKLFSQIDYRGDEMVM
jgi:hypothetical protein